MDEYKTKRLERGGGLEEMGKRLGRKEVKSDEVKGWVIYLTL